MNDRRAFNSRYFYSCIYVKGHALGYNEGQGLLRRVGMKVTIYEDGRVDPPGSARFMSWISEAGFEPRKGLPVGHRRFECNECKTSFVARAGEMTTHECEAHRVPI